jgi:predicted metal-dependent hydrolase
VQTEFLSRLLRPAPAAGESLAVGGRSVPLEMARHPRARRYILRLRADGVARVTIPRGGTEAEARRFAARHTVWLERQLLRQAARPVRATGWALGAELLFRGESVRLTTGPGGATPMVEFGGERVRVADLAGDLRPPIARHLWRLAARELPPRVLELAVVHRLAVTRVTVRNQRARWGSCSRRGTVSLNWRLIQAPAFVRDYIILHELMHLREMNHSPRYWAEVEKVCPDYRVAEKWLREHAALLR